MRTERICAWQCRSKRSLFFLLSGVFRSDVPQVFRARGDMEQLRDAVLLAGKPLVSACSALSSSASLSVVEMQLTACSRCLLGQSFVCAIEREEHVLKFRVKACFFHRYFSSIGLPFLTTVFCALDDDFGANLRKDAFRYTRQGNKKIILVLTLVQASHSRERQRGVSVCDRAGRERRQARGSGGGAMTVVV